MKHNITYEPQKDNTTFLVFFSAKKGNKYECVIRVKVPNDEIKQRLQAQEFDAFLLGNVEPIETRTNGVKNKKEAQEIYNELNSNENLFNLWDILDKKFKEKFPDEKD